MATQVDAADLFNLLESTDLKVAQEIKDLIIENLKSTKESWLLNGLVDFYMVAQSERCLAILATVREPHDKQLFDKLNDHLKGQSNKLQALTLLGYLVHRQPPWLHKVVQHSLFSTLIKNLKTGTDVPILLSGVLVITALLPAVPVTIASSLQEIFEVFSRLASFNLKKPGNVPDVYLLHLHVGIYSLFHRLYGMYPCHFLTYLRSVYTRRETTQVFQKTILPMLQRVKMHPMLVTASKDKELSKERWRRKEVHDIMMECASLSLDPVEGLGENTATCPITEPPSGHDNASDVQSRLPVPESLKTSEAMLLLSADSVVGSVNTGYMWSPSGICGLSTPPPLSSSTHTSTTDLQSSGTQVNTPMRTTPHFFESPLAGSVEQVEKNAQKRMSGLSLSLAGKLSTPTEWATAGDLSVPASPLKPLFTSDPPRSAQKMQAIRKITFNAEEEPKDVVKFYLEAKTDGKPVLVAESIGKTSDRVNSIDVAMDTSTTEDASSPSVSQLSRIIDSLDVHGEDQEVSELTSTSDGKPAGGATEVTSMETEIITDLKHARATSDLISSSEPTDVATELISSTSSASLASQNVLTAESVTTFIKRVNRIRFNSINLTTSSKRLSMRGYVRSTSCPDLHQEMKIHEEGCDVTRSESNQMSLMKADSCAGATGSDGIPMTDSVQSGRSVASSCGVQTDDIPLYDNETARRQYFPYEQLFSLALPPNPCAMCSSRNLAPQDTEAHSTVAAQSLAVLGSPTPLFSSYSPTDLLDRHIARSSDIHAKELSQLPLTSHDSVSWTHFGGQPPTDEVNILRGRILLLHNQLMFERHKRELHAKRNRGLLRRIVKTKSLEEQTTAMKDQLRLQEDEINNLSLSLKLHMQKITDLKTDRDSLEYEKELQHKSIMEEKLTLLNRNKELEELLESQKKENDELNTRLLSSCAREFDLQQELQAVRIQAEFARDLQEQVSRLNKELILMGELQRTYQQRLVAMATSHNPKPEMQFLMDALKAELAVAKQNLDHKTVHLDAARARLGEQDEILKMKECNITEQKKTIEDMKTVFKSQFIAADEKYEVQKKIQQALQGHVMDLQNQLHQLQKPDKPLDTLSHSDEKFLTPESSQQNLTTPDTESAEDAMVVMDTSDSPK